MKNLKPKFKTILRKSNGTRRVQIDCSEEKLTDQSFAKAADINNIMANYHKTGVLPHVKEKVARYIDNTEIPSLMEAHELVQYAQEMFMELPAHIRKLMDNDPTQLQAFIADPQNKETLVKYGLFIENDISGSSKQDVSTPPASPDTKEVKKIAE